MHFPYRYLNKKDLVCLPEYRRIDESYMKRILPRGKNVVNNEKVFSVFGIKKFE